MRRYTAKLIQCGAVLLFTGALLGSAYDSTCVDVTNLAAKEEAEIIEYKLTAGSFLATSDMMHSNSDRATTFQNMIEIVGLALDDGSEPIITDVSYTRYVTSVLNIRRDPNLDGEVAGKFVIGDEVTVTGEIENSDYVRITYKGEDAFIHSDYLSEEKPEPVEVINYTWSGAVLNRSDGTVKGPSGKETYYNLDMSHVVENMHSMGVQGDYWVRSDGCKMLGDYIIVAANLDIRPKGTLVETSLGMGIVCDTGDFAASNAYQLDIATTW